jgi:death on curing protein
MEIITLRDVEYISFRLAKETLSFNEPIPEFTTRFPNLLESSLVIPFQKFSRKSLYPTFVSKASILFYLMIKNHPFQNGNKRIAMTTLFVFLYINDKWLKIDIKELYNFTIWIAESPSQLKDEVARAIEKFLKRHMTALEY